MTFAKLPQTKDAARSGNAMWFILIAVALLAALTATITSSSDTTEQSGRIEQMRVEASDIMRFAKGLEQAISQMTMRNIAMNDISFQHQDAADSDLVNPNCEDGTGCRLFARSGMGLGYKNPPEGWLDAQYENRDTYGQWEFTAFNNVEEVGGQGADLVVFLGYLKKPLCAEINFMLDTVSEENNPPEDSDGFDATPYTGVVQDNQTINGLPGEKTGCVRMIAGSDERGYMFYHVLVER